jgi:hypothetical protein
MTPEHYDMEIQPITYIMANGLGFCEGNIVKYVSRYKGKGGIEDLKKARHYLDMLIDSIEKEIPELILTSPSDDSMAIYESLKDQLIRCRESK